MNFGISFNIAQGEDYSKFLFSTYLNSEVLQGVKIFLTALFKSYLRNMKVFLDCGFG